MFNPLFPTIGKNRPKAGEKIPPFPEVGKKSSNLWK
jgi:hypothetical protein